MSGTYASLLEHTVEIAASPARVWRLVSDVRRMPEWSPQVISTRLRSGYDRVGIGAEFTNLNKSRELEWITHGEIVRFAPEREVAFRIAENWAVWSFQLAATAGGTRLTERRETPDGLSELSLSRADTYFGGQDAVTASLRDGMRQTLERIKAAAEGSSHEAADHPAHR